MAHSSDEVFDSFKRRLDALVALYQRPEERRIGHGNLRHSYSPWKSNGEYCTNVALVYETPGGSTTQLNVTFDHNTGEFSYLDDTLEHRISTSDPDQVFDYFNDHITEISRKRLTQLTKTIDSWLGEGKDRGQVLAELNKLLQADFLGGRVTSVELRMGIQHALVHFREGG